MVGLEALRPRFNAVREAVITAQRDVDALLRQVDETIVEQQFGLQPRVLGQELQQPGIDTQVPQGERRAHAQQAGRRLRQALHRFERLGMLFEQALGVGMERVTGAAALLLHSAVALAMLAAATSNARAALSFARLTPTYTPTPSTSNTSCRATCWRPSRTTR